MSLSSTHQQAAAPNEKSPPALTGPPSAELTASHVMPGRGRKAWATNVIACGPTVLLACGISSSSSTYKLPLDRTATHGFPRTSGREMPMLKNREPLLAFITESNAIEGIHRSPTDVEIAAHVAFLSHTSPTVEDIETFVTALLSQYWLGSDPMPSPLRASAGMDIRVGSHRSPPGGPHVRDALAQILEVSATDVSVSGTRRTHIAYEALHPFIDGNGRSGRVLWAWQEQRGGRDPFAIPFLQRWYYDSLDEGPAA